MTNNAKAVNVTEVFSGPKSRGNNPRSIVAVNDWRKISIQPIAYPIIENGAANLWMQPLDGGPPHQLTESSPGASAIFTGRSTASNWR